MNQKKQATKGTRKGNGAGWGGPAKGAAVNRVERTIAVGQPGPGRGKFTVEGEERAAARERRSIALQENLWELAFSAEAEAVRVQASVHALNRIDGMPLQTTIVATTDDLTDEERSAQLAAFSATLASPTLGPQVSLESHSVGNSSPGPDAADASATSSGTAEPS